jgi:pimeloyl-ACP methyl ester carboxylesterase
LDRPDFSEEGMMTARTLVLAAIFPASLALPALGDGVGADSVEAGGTTYRAIVAGSGPPVILVHGLLADSRAWSGIKDATVASGHRFIAYDQRGFGAGSRIDPSATRDRHTYDLLDILGAVGEPADLVGWSYSGPILLRAAAEAPERVRRVVVFEPFVPEMLGGTPEADAAAEAFGALWGPTSAALDAGDTAGATRAAVEAVFGLGEGGFAGKPSAVQEMQLDSGPAFVAFWNTPDPVSMTCEELGAVEAPTLIVTGSETLPAFTEMAKAVAACVPKAEAAVMEGVGHGGPIEAPEAFGKLALGFIDAR